MLYACLIVVSLTEALKTAGAAQGLVKRFFNEKEVTSTLVMDALFSGCKQVEEASRAGLGPKVCAMMRLCQEQHTVCQHRL